MTHKNVSFWIRILYRTLDLITFAALIFLTFFLLIQKPMNVKHQIKPLNYYLFWTFTIIYAFVLYILIPFCFNGRTLWMIIFRTQVLFNENPEVINNKAIFKMYLARSVYNFWVWIVIALIYLALIYPPDFKSFIEFSLKAKDPKSQNFKFSIVYYSVSTLIGVIGAFYVIDYAFIILNKKHLGLIDMGTNSRVVYWKHYKKDANEQIVLIPFKTENQKVNFIN